MDRNRSDIMGYRKKEHPERGGEFKFGLTLAQTNTREHGFLSFLNATLRYVGASKVVFSVLTDRFSCSQPHEESTLLSIAKGGKTQPCTL